MLDASAKTLINEAEEASISNEELVTDKFGEESVEVTIQEVGVYLHPTIQIQWSQDNGETAVRNYGTYNTPRVSLLEYVFSEDTQYTVDEYQSWFQNGRVPEPVLESYKSWVVSKDHSFSNLYNRPAETADALMNQSSLRPEMHLAIILEDATGIQYVSFCSAYENGEAAASFLAEVTEQEDDGTEFHTGDTTATYACNGVLETESSALQLSATRPINWFSYPFIQFALQPISESTYQFLHCYDDGWYKASIPLNTDGVASQNEVLFDTPLDPTRLHSGVSWGSETLVHQFLEQGGGSSDGRVNVHICPRYVEHTKASITDETVTAYSSINSWTVVPGLHPDTPSEDEDSDQSDTDSAAETSDTDTGNTEEKSLLQRLLGF